MLNKPIKESLMDLVNLSEHRRIYQKLNVLRGDSSK